MKVILDTNIFCTDYRMESTGFKVFFSGLHALDIGAYIPAVVYQEVLNKYSEVLNEHIDEINKSAHHFQRLTGIIINKDISLKSCIDEYKEHFDKKLLINGIKQLSYPSTPHEKLVHRELSRKRPFNPKGTGYRDALIWESVINFLKETPKAVIFITQNTRDFFKDKNHIHPDLLEDLNEHSVAIEQLIVVDSLNKFNETYILPKLEHINTARASLSNKIGHWVESNITDMINNNDYNFFFSPIDHMHVRIAGIKRLLLIEIKDIRILSSSEIVVHVNFEAEFDISLSADYDDYIKNNDISNWFGHIDVGEYASTSIDIDATISLCLVLAADKSNILAGEIIKIDTGFYEVEFDSTIS